MPGQMQNCKADKTCKDLSNLSSIEAATNINTEALAMQETAALLPGTPLLNADVINFITNSDHCFAEELGNVRSLLCQKAPNSANMQRLLELEKWETCKRRCIQRLFNEIDDLNVCDAEANDIKAELNAAGIQIDESMIYQLICEERELAQRAKQRANKSPEANDSSDMLAAATTSTACSQNMFEDRKLKYALIPGATPREDQILLGANGTTILRKDFNTIDWSQTAGAITRKILMLVFDRNTLAFNTLSGKPSPAFLDRDMPNKNRLDPNKVADITQFIVSNMEATEKEIRFAITSKCADENKMFRQREKKRLSLEPNTGNYSPN